MKRTVQANLGEEHVPVMGINIKVKRKGLTILQDLSPDRPAEGANIKFKQTTNYQEGQAVPAGIPSYKTYENPEEETRIRSKSASKWRQDDNIYEPKRASRKINRQNTEDLELTQQVIEEGMQHPKWWGDGSEEKKNKSNCIQKVSKHQYTAEKVHNKLDSNSQSFINRNKSPVLKAAREECDRV